MNGTQTPGDMNASVANTTEAPDEYQCLTALTVSHEYVNYAGLPMLALVIAMSFLVRRKRLYPNCCGRRPGILTPMNLVKNVGARMALAAAFVILTSRLTELLVGEAYWSFSQDPEFLVKFSFLKVFIKMINSVQLSICFYPLFACIQHRRYIILNILGFCNLIPWAYYTVHEFTACDDSTEDGDITLYLLFVARLPELLAFAYMIWFFARNMYSNVIMCRSKKGIDSGCLNRMHDSEGSKMTKEEPLCIVYVRGLLTRKPEPIPTSSLATFKESLTYRKVQGLEASPKILVALTVSFVAVFQMFWVIFTNIERSHDAFQQLLDTLVPIISSFSQISMSTIQPIAEDYFRALIYGGYVANVIALMSQIISTCRVYTNYRRDVRRILSGDKYLFSYVQMTPAVSTVSGMRFPGFQIAFSFFGFLVTFGVWVLVLVIILSWCIILPIKWGLDSFMVGLLKKVSQAAVVSIAIYYTQILCAKYIFFDREHDTYGNSRVYQVADYFLFFFNTLLNLFSAFKRILMSAVFGIWYMSRLDQCAMIRGFERFDTGHKSYLGMLYVETQQNNPTALAFIHILRQGVKRRGSKASIILSVNMTQIEGGTAFPDAQDETVAKKRATRKWWKAVTLINNPILIEERTSKRFWEIRQDIEKELENEEHL